MIRRRDVLTAGAALAASLGVVREGETATAQTAAAQTPATPAPAATGPLIGSSTFDFAKMAARPTKVGSVRQVCRNATATLDELECHITTLNAGEMPHPPHKHADEEVVILKEGTLEVTLGDRTETVGPGSVIFQASNQMHAVKNVGTTPAIYHVIKWNSPGMLKRK
jgi:mannose-6-phosphate isomerase-like protein (cupin superfamily)